MATGTAAAATGSGAASIAGSSAGAASITGSDSTVSASSVDSKGSSTAVASAGATKRSTVSVSAGAVYCSAGGAAEARGFSSKASRLCPQSGQNVNFSANPSSHELQYLTIFP